MQRVLRGRIAKLRSTFGLIVVLVAVVTVGLPTSASATQSSSGVEVRIGAQRLDDGRTEFGLQVWDGEYWGEWVLPQSRFFPTNSRVDRWLNASVLTLESGHVVRISAKLLEDDRIEFALQQRIGEEWVGRLLPRPRFFPADPAAERWLYSGRLEPVGYVPYQSRAPTVQGAQTFASWYQRSGSGQDVFQSGVSVDERVEGHGTTTTNGKLFLNVMCDVPLDEAGTFMLEVLGFQHLSGVRIYAPLTYQLGDAEPEDAEWRASGDALDQFGVRLRPLEDEAFYEQMRGASSLRIQIEGSPDVDVSFDIRGFFKTTLQDNLEQCGNYLPQPWPDRFAPTH